MSFPLRLGEPRAPTISLGWLRKKHRHVHKLCCCRRSRQQPEISNSGRIRQISAHYFYSDLHLHIFGSDPLFTNSIEVLFQIFYCKKQPLRIFSSGDLFHQLQFLLLGLDPPFFYCLHGAFLHMSCPVFTFSRVHSVYLMREGGT